MNTAADNQEIISSNLAVIDEVDRAAKALHEQYKDLPALDYSDPDGYAAAKERKKPLTKLRTKCEGARKEAGRVLLAEKLRIDDTAKRIFAVIAEHEQPLIDGIKAEDARVEREAREAAEKEQQRIDGIESRFAALPAMLSAITIDDLSNNVQALKSYNFTGFDEYEDAAREKVNATLVDLQARLKTLQEQEAAAAELKAAQDALVEQRAEMARQQAEIDAEKQRIEQQKRDESLRAEMETKAAAEKLAAVEKAKQDAIDTERERVAEEERKRVAEEQSIAAEKKAADDEAARRAAMAPDVEKMKAYSQRIRELISAAPKVNTEDGKRRLRVVLDYLHKAELAANDGV